MKALITFALVLTVTACKEPDTLPADETPLSSVSEKQLQQDAKTIEQAADEAVRLIEEEAKAETDANAQVRALQTVN